MAAVLRGRKIKSWVLPKGRVIKRLKGDERIVLGLENQSRHLNERKKPFGAALFVIIQGIAEAKTRGGIGGIKIDHGLDTGKRDKGVSFWHQSLFPLDGLPQVTKKLILVEAVLPPLSQPTRARRQIDGGRDSANGSDVRRRISAPLASQL